jgi:hypothetical protein
MIILQVDCEGYMSSVILSRQYHHTWHPLVDIVLYHDVAIKIAYNGQVKEEYTFLKQPG